MAEEVFEQFSPTELSELRAEVMRLQAKLQVHKHLGIDSTEQISPISDKGAIVVSDGVTGGSGSAGIGKQYVQMEINGTIYKILHDGTV